MEASTRNDEDELSGLCLPFSELALSGSFSGHISSTIHLLKLRRKTMQGEGVHEDGPKRMDKHIKTLQRKRSSRLRRKTTGANGESVGHELLSKLAC